MTTGSSFENWPIDSVTINTSCLTCQGNAAPEIYGTVFGFRQRIGFGSTHQLNSNETL